jgi:hypothetical protein
MLRRALKRKGRALPVEASNSLILLTATLNDHSRRWVIANHAGGISGEKTVVVTREQRTRCHAGGLRDVADAVGGATAGGVGRDPPDVAERRW